MLDRLREAENLDGPLSQSFTYAPNGNMLTNSALGTYEYPNSPNAPRPHAPLAIGSAFAFNYDANGNMRGDGTRR